jgi:hypothetical protein
MLGALGGEISTTLCRETTLALLSSYLFLSILSKDVLVSKMLQLKNRKINATGPILPWKSPHNCLVGSLGGCTMLLTITDFVKRVAF